MSDTSILSDTSETQEKPEGNSRIEIKSLTEVENEHKSKTLGSSGNAEDVLSSDDLWNVDINTSSSSMVDPLSYPPNRKSSKKKSCTHIWNSTTQRASVGTLELKWLRDSVEELKKSKDMVDSEVSQIAEETEHDSPSTSSLLENPPNSKDSSDITPVEDYSIGNDDSINLKYSASRDELESENTEVPRLPERPKCFKSVKKKKIAGNNEEGAGSISYANNMMRHESKEVLVGNHTPDQNTNSSLQDWQNIDFSQSSVQLNLYNWGYSVPISDNYFYPPKDNFLEEELDNATNILEGVNINQSPKNSGSLHSIDSIYYPNKDGPPYSIYTDGVNDNTVTNYGPPEEQTQKKEKVDTDANVMLGSGTENIITSEIKDSTIQPDVKPTFSRYTLRRKKYITSPIEGEDILSDNYHSDGINVNSNNQSSASTSNSELLYRANQNRADLYDLNPPSSKEGEKSLSSSTSDHKQVDVIPVSQNFQQHSASKYDNTHQLLSAEILNSPREIPQSISLQNLQIIDGDFNYKREDTTRSFSENNNVNTSNPSIQAHVLHKSASTNDYHRTPPDTHKYRHFNSSASNIDLIKNTDDYGRHQRVPIDKNNDVSSHKIPPNFKIGDIPRDKDAGDKNELPSRSFPTHHSVPQGHSSVSSKYNDVHVEDSFDPTQLNKISLPSRFTPPALQYPVVGIKSQNRDSDVIKVSFENTIRMYRMNAKKSQDPVVKFAFAKFCLAQSQKAKTKADADELIEEGYKLLKKLALSGHADSMYTLGEAYIDDKRYDLGYAQLIQAAKRSHVGACFAVARCAEKGYGTKKSNANALGFYTKAAQAGWKPALYRLGLAELNGELGLKPNPKKAVMWLRRAAAVTDKDNLDSLLLLALIFEKGITPYVLPDLKYARGVLIEAAKLGSASAQYVLGNAYEVGRFGCQIDVRAAIFWYNSAARLRNPEAQFTLASWYLKGYPGVLEVNENYSYFWAYEAAVNGHAKSQYAIGNFSENGIGCQKDFSRSMRWYAIAAKNGNESAKKRLIAERNTYTKSMQSIPETAAAQAKIDKGRNNVKSGGFFRGRWR